MKAIAPDDQSSTGFITSLSNLLKATAQPQRAISARTGIALATVHGLLRATGGFPTEDTVRAIAKAYDPDNEAVWLRARNNAAETVPARPPAPSLRDLQQQVAEQQQELGGLREEVAELTKVVYRLLADPPVTSEEQMRIQEQEARRWLMTCLHPRFSRGNQGYPFLVVNQFISKLRELLKDKDIEQFEAHLNLNADFLGDGPSSGIGTYYDAGEVEEWFDEIHQDVADFFEMLPPKSEIEELF
ncbi:hypothetical protein [Streptomyces virginiae]|uniref:hypothetical protein n=1 Tax=Streptomyces virginiae TaxID=1961 RepID=UPI003252B41F